MPKIYLKKVKVESRSCNYCYFDKKGYCGNRFNLQCIHENNKYFIFKRVNIKEKVGLNIKIKYTLILKI
jgi:hypothetical protein